MDLPKNRGGKSYQADIGKDAFTGFFPGRVGGRIDVVVNTIDSKGFKSSKTRQLVDVKSSNYRLEIDFPGKYPSGRSRPIVVFRKRSASEFDCLLLMPTDKDHRAAGAVLEKYAAPKVIRRVRVNESDVRLVWPSRLLKMTRVGH